MSLRKKIISSFFISAFIIAILAAFEYVNFIQVRNEMRFLEVTDIIRSRSLQLRRHEKNFLLYPEKQYQESSAIYEYLLQLDGIAESLRPSDSEALRRLVRQYREHFSNVEVLILDITGQLQALKGQYPALERFAPLIESSFRDRPTHVSQFLRNSNYLREDSALALNLVRLESRIEILRKVGEDIIYLSDTLDRRAMSEADRGIGLSQVAMLIFFPVFLIFGLSTLIYISSDVVKRLRRLTDSIEETGMRYLSRVSCDADDINYDDEVDALIYKFNNMNMQLEQWEEDLYDKNQELLKSKKLALIGTMASGVAHELNNPLSNISLSAQVLRTRMPKDSLPDVLEIVEDIYAQTARVKGIVIDLLEFAREKEPQLEYVELRNLVGNAYQLVRRSINTGDLKFIMDAPDKGVHIMADAGQMERVFVNLFTNAVAAMDGSGEIIAKIRDDEAGVNITISDTGRGMTEEDVEKVFDPFFTKRERGTGLGLAIVMNIVRKHGGEISVVSEEGEGTAFEISIPRGEG